MSEAAPSAEKDVAEALARYAPMIWEAGRNAGVQDALHEHGPSDERERLLWLVMTPRVEENPYAGVPFEFEAHGAVDGDALLADLRDLLGRTQSIISTGFRQEVVLAADLREVLDRHVLPPGKGHTEIGEPQ